MMAHQSHTLQDQCRSPARLAPIASPESSQFSSTCDLESDDGFTPTPRSSPDQSSHMYDDHIGSLSESFQGFMGRAEGVQYSSRMAPASSTPRKKSSIPLGPGPFSMFSIPSSEEATPRASAALTGAMRNSPVVSMYPSFGSCESSVFCRICHDGDSQEDLIAPCKCSGTMGLLHQSCIERWLGSTNSNKCEICGFEYLTERKPKSFKQWLIHPSHRRDRRNLIGDSVCLCLLTPLAAISAWLCISGAHNYAKYENTRWEAAGLVTLSVFLLLIYLIWVAVAVRYHRRVYSEWQSSNQVVRVLGLSDNVRQLMATSQPATAGHSDVLTSVHYRGSPRRLLSDLIHTSARGSFSEVVLTPVILENASRYLPHHVLRNLSSPSQHSFVFSPPGSASSQGSMTNPHTSISDTVLLLPVNQPPRRVVRETYV